MTDYHVLVKDVSKYKEVEDIAINHNEVQELIDALTEQGTLESYELIQSLINDKYSFDWEEFAWSIAKSGDLRVLDHWLFEEVDIVELLSELLKTIHLPVIEWLFENFEDDIKSYHLTSETPVLFEYCAEKGIFLDVVCKEAYPALKGERLADVLMKCIMLDHYPPLDIAVRSDSLTVESLLLFEPEQSDEMITEAFEVVNDDKIAQVLLDAFPAAEIYVDDLINAVHNHLPSILLRIENEEQLDMLLILDNTYWDDYNKDITWMLNTLRPRLKDLNFSLTSKIVKAVAEEVDHDLLKFLVNNFNLS